MNSPFVLNNSLTLGLPAHVLVTATHVSCFQRQQAQGLGDSQRLPARGDAFRGQQTVSKEQGWDPAHFPKGDRVVVSADGVFVPSALFGQSPGLRFHLQTGSHGREVVVYSQPSARQMSERETSRESEQRWLVANRARHVGQWVALSGNRFLACGSNASEVYGKARALGVAVPFVAYLDADDHLPFAGW